LAIVFVSILSQALLENDPCYMNEGGIIAASGFRDQPATGARAGQVCQFHVFMEISFTYNTREQKLWIAQI
jgi:hypothetical protein